MKEKQLKIFKVNIIIWNYFNGRKNKHGLKINSVNKRTPTEILKQNSVVEHIVTLIDRWSLGTLSQPL